MLQIVSNLRGYSIEAKDGSIGTASDFLFDDSSMKVRWLVVDTYFGANQAGEAERTTTHDVDPHLRSIVEVTGYHVHATDGSIGYVENFLVDSESWVIRYLTIDTSNWWFGQHVLISPHAVKEVDWTARYIRLDIARVQVKASPPWNPTIPIDEEFEEQLYSHYDWPSSERKSVFDSHQQRP